MSKPATQKERVIAVSLQANRPLLLGELAEACEALYGTMDTEAAISARLREIGRSPDYSVRKQNNGNRTWRYQVLANSQCATPTQWASRYCIARRQNKAKVEQMNDQARGFDEPRRRAIKTCIQHHEHNIQQHGFNQWREGVEL